MFFSLPREWAEYLLVFTQPPVMTSLKLFSQSESKCRGTLGTDPFQLRVIILNKQFAGFMMVSAFYTCNSLSDNRPPHRDNLVWVWWYLRFHMYKGYLNIDNELWKLLKNCILFNTEKMQNNTQNNSKMNIYHMFVCIFLFL